MQLFTAFQNSDRKYFQFSGKLEVKVILTEAKWIFDLRYEIKLEEANNKQSCIT